MAREVEASLASDEQQWERQGGAETEAVRVGNFCRRMNDLAASGTERWLQEPLF